MNKYNCLSLFHHSVFTSAFTYQSKVVISAKSSLLCLPCGVTKVVDQGYTKFSRHELHFAIRKSWRAAVHRNVVRKFRLKLYDFI